MKGLVERLIKLSESVDTDTHNELINIATDLQNEIDYLKTTLIDVEKNNQRFHNNRELFHGNVYPYNTGIYKASISIAICNLIDGHAYNSDKFIHEIEKKAKYELENDLEQKEIFQIEGIKKWL